MVVKDGGSRRERVRAATVDEIKSTALRLLVEQGPTAMTLRAIAREMGMTAPGLYRYFPSHEDLVDALVADTYGRLSAVLVQARDGAGPDVVERLVATARAFHDWAVAHPREFGLVFASPVPSIAGPGTTVQQAGIAFGGVFTVVFLELWAIRPFPVVADEALPPDLVEQLGVYRETVAALFGAGAAQVPIGALYAFLRAWVQLFGLVTMEIYHHLHFCLQDVGSFFEASLHDIGTMLGIEKVPPVSR